MEKVKVSKEQAQKIEELKAKYGTEKFFYEHARDGRWTCACLNEIKPFEMARILIEWYDIVMTLEEQVAHHYESEVWSLKLGHKSYVDIYRDGMCYALGKFGLRVEGVNA